MTRIYNSGPQSIFVRAFTLVVAVGFFALAVACLIAIPFPHLLLQRESIVGSLIGAGFAVLMGIVIGTAGQFASTIDGIGHDVLRLSHDWLFGTLHKDFRISNIDHFKVSSVRRGAFGGGNVRYQVQLITREPCPPGSGIVVAGVYRLMGKIKIDGTPLNQIEDLVELEIEEMAIQLMEKLNQYLQQIPRE